MLNKKSSSLLLLIFVFLIVFPALIFTNKSLGFSWDEGLYFHPAQSAFEWIIQSVKGNIHPITDVEVYFQEVPELPPFEKFLAGFSYYSGKAVGVDILTSFRWMNMALFCLFGWFIAKYIRRFFPRANRFWFLAPFVFASFPRVFGHAHFACADLPSAFWIFIATYVFLKTVSSDKKIPALFVFVSVMGMITKFNNLVHLCGLFLCWILWYHDKENLKKLAMAVGLTCIGTLICWPWLWQAPWKNFLWYFGFFFQHQKTSVFFMGTHYAGEKAPWYYPFVMFWLTTSPFVLFSGIAALIRTAVCYGHKIKNIFARASLPILLTWGCALYPIFLLLLPNAPTYDGVRLFLPSYAFITVLFCVGLDMLFQAFTPRIQKLGLYFMSVCIAAVFFFQLFSWNPFYLSYYNFFAGTKARIAEKYEVTYWLEPLNPQFIAYMNQRIKPGESVRCMAMSNHILQRYQDVGLLRKDILINEEPPYDYHLLNYRRGLFGRMETFLIQNKIPVKRVMFHRSPLMLLYHSKREF